MADDDDGGTLAAEAELFFLQIGLGDVRERERLLALGHETSNVPCGAIMLVRTTDSSNVAPER